MRTFTRREIATLLEIDEMFVVQLEQELILQFDVRDSTYSENMLERARVAHSLVVELEVNLAGVAIILRMRDDLGQLRSNVRALAAALGERGKLE